VKAVGLEVIGLKPINFNYFIFTRFILKRKIMLILLAAGLVASVSAQGWGKGMGHPKMHNHGPRQVMAETVTVSGSLIVAHGMPALKSGDVTYLIGALNRLTGFVEGLKEGAQVTIEGSALSVQKNNNFKFLRPLKLTLAGKDYDLTPLLSPFGMNRQEPRAPQRDPRRQFNFPNGQHRQNRPKTF